jgi:hypothetical protein
MFAVLIYIAAIVAANLSVAHFGPWVSPINAFLLIGLDLALRDHLHDKWRGPQLWPKMLGLLVVAGGISYLLNPAAGKIAVASVVAFCVAGLIDAVVYHWLRDRPFMQRSNVSNGAGALADSLIFPTLAFGGFLPHIVALQFAAKLVGGFVWSAVIYKTSRAPEPTT